MLQCLTGSGATDASLRIGEYAVTEAFITLTIASAMLLGSPGPATLSLAAVGATFGVKRGLPYLAGILLGLTSAMAGAVFGVATIFVQWPQAKWIVQLCGAVYLTYIAFRIATAPVLENGDSEQHDMPGLRDGFVLNLLNPKAYAAFFVLFSQFLMPLEAAVSGYVVTAVIVVVVGIVVDSIWLAIGSAIRAIFSHPRYARPTRVLFGLSIVAATLWSFL
jgi:threonine/homoserine/homoserine lactone efflux protein